MIATFVLLPFLGFPSPPLLQQADPEVRVEKSPRGDLVVVEPGLTLSTLVRRGGEVLGRVYLARAQEQNLLQGTPLGISAPQSVPLPDFEPWLEGVLRTHDFATVVPPEGAGEPSQLVSLRGEGRSMLVTGARLVPVEDLAGFRHPGTLIRTPLDLKHMDAMRAAVNLRPLFTDPNIETVSVVGTSNTLLLQGFPRSVGTWVEILRRADVAPPEPPADLQRLVQRSRAREEEGMEVKLRRIEEALDALRAAVRDLVADSRR